MERMFGLDWQLIADASLTLIAVFVLFTLLSYLLFAPARKMLEGRSEKIKNELDQAKSDMEKAESLKAEYEEKIKNIEKEAEEIMSEARKKALLSENQIVNRAKEDAAAIVDRAQAEARLEKQKMSDDIKKEIISVASVMAGKVVNASIDTTVQNDLIDETLKEIGEDTWQN
ncbi:MAG: F0F1 ATP synthase subunit B [Acetatifactor sp.]|nr:F0F1 ATP synthase subunit B [Acetatifactor sp.]